MTIQVLCLKNPVSPLWLIGSFDVPLGQVPAGTYRTTTLARGRRKQKLQEHSSISSVASQNQPSSTRLPSALKTLANDFDNLYSAHDPSAMEFAVPQGKTAGAFLG
jgi:hypothetical protein